MYGAHHENEKHPAQANHYTHFIQLIDLTCVAYGLCANYKWERLMPAGDTNMWP